MRFRTAFWWALGGLSLAIALLGGFFGAAYYVEALRVREATPAFQPLLPMNPCILSNPVGFNRYCCYIVEFSPESSLSDANLAALACLNRLPEQNDLTLVINSPAVTDESLSQLKKLRTLDYLNVTGSAISDAGIEELCDALPEVTVVRRTKRPAHPDPPQGAPSDQPHG